MIAIKHNNSIIELIKIYSSYLQQIQEISTTITAYFVNGDLSSGSGFLIEYNSQIYVATAAHVILSGSTLAQSIYVTYYKNGKNYFKQINTTGQNDNIYYNILSDVAFLKLNDSKVSIIPFGYANSRSLSIGSSCIVIGNPLSSDINSYSFGVVRDNNYVYGGLNNSYESLLVDAATYSGNSGGMMLSLNENNTIQIIGMLQYGFLHSANVPTENFGGGISSSFLSFVTNTILSNGKKGEYVFPTLKLKTRPIDNRWLFLNSQSQNHNTQDGCYLTSSFNAVSPNPLLSSNTVIEKINGQFVGAQLGGYNVLSILLELYQSNQTSVVILTVINNGNEVPYTYVVKDLFNTSGATQQNSEFMFDTKEHYLL
jgi:hypothetical protein